MGRDGRRPSEDRPQVRVVLFGVGDGRAVPVCPRVSEELGYLYRSCRPMHRVTQPRLDGEMETCFEDGLMGGWGRGTLPASIPGRCHPALRGPPLPGKPRMGQLPRFGTPVASMGHLAPRCVTRRVPKSITVAQPGVAGRDSDPHPGLDVRPEISGVANPRRQAQGVSPVAEVTVLGVVPPPRLVAPWRLRAPCWGQGSPGQQQGEAGQVGACSRERGPAGSGRCGAMGRGPQLPGLGAPNPGCPPQQLADPEMQGLVSVPRPGVCPSLSIHPSLVPCCVPMSPAAPFPLCPLRAQGCPAAPPRGAAIHLLHPQRRGFPKKSVPPRCRLPHADDKTPPGVSARTLGGVHGASPPPNTPVPTGCCAAGLGGPRLQGGLRGDTPEGMG